MRKLYILNDGRTIVTENAEYGSAVGIKAIYNLDELPDEEFTHLLHNRPDFTPVIDKQGKLKEMKSVKRRIQVNKLRENI